MDKSTPNNYQAKTLLCGFRYRTWAINGQIGQFLFAQFATIH